MRYTDARKRGNQQCCALATGLGQMDGLEIYRRRLRLRMSYEVDLDQPLLRPGVVGRSDRDNRCDNPASETSDHLFALPTLLSTVCARRHGLVRRLLDFVGPTNSNSCRGLHRCLSGYRFATLVALCHVIEDGHGHAREQE